MEGKKSENRRRCTRTKVLRGNKLKAIKGEMGGRVCVFVQMNEDVGVRVGGGRGDSGD